MAARVPDPSDAHLTFAARQAARAAERAEIAREIREGVKSPEQIAREHQPLAALTPARAKIRFDLVRRLS